VFNKAYGDARGKADGGKKHVDLDQNLPGWAKYGKLDSLWNRRVFVPTHSMVDPAKIKGDSALAWLPGLQGRAEVAIQNGDSDAYREVASAFLAHVGNLHIENKLHPLGCDPHLLFVGESSPIHDVLFDCLLKCFERACIAHGSQGPNNRSGYSLSGLKGTGKSMVLHLTTITSTLLLPNFVAVFVDAAASTTENSISPHLLLKAAMASLGFDSLVHLSHLDSLIKSSSAKGLALGVFVDDVHDWYLKKPDCWVQLHTLLQDHRSCCFIADSTSAVPHYVRGDQDAIMGLLPDEMSAVEKMRHMQVPLNGDKMLCRHIPTFDNVEQYRTFFTNRLHLVPNGSTKTINDDFITGVHIRSGGRLQEISDLLTGVSRSCSIEHTSFKLPDVRSVPMAILLEMVDATVKAGGRFDPWNLPQISDGTVMRMLNDMPSTHTKYGLKDLNRFVEEGWIAQVRSTTSDAVSYTFATASQLLATMRWVPVTFVSHAWVDARGFTEGPLYNLHIQFKREYIGIVMCEDSAKEMCNLGVKTWEVQQIVQAFDDGSQCDKDGKISSGLGGFVIIVLSKNYVHNAATEGTGCNREINSITKQLVVKPEMRKRVLFAYMSKHDHNGQKIESSDGPIQLLKELPVSFRQAFGLCDTNADDPYIWDLSDANQHKSLADNIVGRIEWVTPDFSSSFAKKSLKMAKELNENAQGTGLQTKI
jgi:hypothetical protein